MNTTATLPPRSTRATSSAQSNPARFLYSAFALLLLGLTFLGFQQFYLHGRAVGGRELVAPIRGLLIAHGVTMTLWILLFAVQPLLIAGANRRLHMTLGFFGVGLAVCIVPLGLWTAIAMAKVGPELVRSGMNRTQFLAVQFNSLLMFAALATIGIVNRRRPEIHRPMMFLATLATMGAALARILPLRELYMGTVWSTWFGPYFFSLIIGLAFLATKTALTRSFDRWLAGGLTALIVADALTMRIGPTATWEQIAQFFIR